MRYTDIACFTADHRAVVMVRECSKCGARIERIRRAGDTKDPVYCPDCGLKFKQRPEAVAVPALVSLLNVMVETHKPTPANDRRKRDRQKKRVRNDRENAGASKA